MRKKDKNDRVVTVVLALVILFSIGALIYVSLPSENNNQQNVTNESVILTLIYKNESFNYTMSQLEGIGSFTGMGSYIKKSGTIVGPNNYTGIPVSTLVDEIPSLPNNYTVEIICSDGWTMNYTIEEVNGSVPIYNESGNKTGIGNMTMILAYEKNSEPISKKDGPLRVAFVDNHGSITNSKLWAKSVAMITILT